jgi:hypothetical protein
MDPMDREVARIAAGKDADGEPTEEASSPTLGGMDLFEQPADFKWWSKKK